MSTKGTCVGGDIDSMCTKCKLLLSHTIVAMVGEMVAKVKCNTCGSEHRYLPPASERERRESRARAAKSERRLPIVGALASKHKIKAGVVKAGDFDIVMKDRDISRARKYRPAEIFQVNEVVNHSTFGLGLVTAIKGPQKVEILFETGPKILVHGRG